MYIWTPALHKSHVKGVSSVALFVCLEIYALDFSDSSEDRVNKLIQFFQLGLIYHSKSALMFNLGCSF